MTFLQRIEPIFTETARIREVRANARKAAKENQDSTGKTKNRWRNFECWGCGEKGHVLSLCPRQSDKKNCKHQEPKSEQNPETTNSTATLPEDTKNRSGANNQDTKEEKPPHASQFFDQRRHVNMALTCVKARQDSAAISVRVMTDSCCNTTLLGKGWKVISQDETRFVSMSGFNG